MHEPDRRCPPLGPQRVDEIPCRDGVGQEQVVELQTAKLVGTGREVHDYVTVANCSHGSTHCFPIRQVTDSSIDARMPADRYDLMATGPQHRHRRRAEIPGSPGDDNPHAATTACWHRSRKVTNENPSSFRS